METLLRQWTMLRLIPRYPRRVDTNRLQDELNQQGFPITLRSIQRDLNKLSAVLPIGCDQSKPQGWWWQADADLLEIPGLDPQAALVFKMAEQHLKQALPSATLDNLRPWFRAANGVLDAQPNGVGGWLDKMRILPSGPPLAPPFINPEIQSTVYQALLENKRLAVEYRPQDAPKPKSYEINALSIVQRGNLLYVVCTIREYTNPMLLLMHRLGAAFILDKAATVPDNFDIDRYIENGELGFRLGPPVKLVAEFNAKASRLFHETPLSEDQKIRSISTDRVRITATVSNTMEIRAWLRGFGKNVSVISPHGFLDEQ